MAKRGYLDVEVTIFHTLGEIQSYKQEKGKYFYTIGHHSTQFVDTALHNVASTSWMRQTDKYQTKVLCRGQHEIAVQKHTTRTDI